MENVEQLASDSNVRKTSDVDSTVNPAVVASEYAVRGAIASRAACIEEDLKSGIGSYDFDGILYCNIGNPQALAQKPVSYGRRLVACCECQESGFADGASSSVHLLLSAMIKDAKDTFLVPVPQYPLYSAALTLYGGTLVPYFLDEDSGWKIDVDGISASIAELKQRGLRVRGIVVINPGNPTGQVLSLENQVQLLEVCAAAGVPIIADEVYQQNVWAEGKRFTSFRKVLSLHSTSKGFFGECGHRGGYMDALNCPDVILQQVVKLMSISLCPNTVGQVMMGALMAPPVPGDESYEEYNAETTAILESLKRRASKMVAAMRQLEGVTCCESEGALYVFPRLTIPPAAQAAAEADGVEPDFLYCLELLNATGIVTVPGSGFKQAPGTQHMRVTILPQEAAIDAVITRLSAFHRSFMDKYRA